MVNNYWILKLLYRLGWVLVVVFSFMGILLASEFIFIPFLPIGFIFLPAGCGFFFLVPWTYIKADEKRKQQGQIDHFRISYCFKLLILGFSYIFAFFYFLYKF
jgi:hypothetical protein